MKDDDVTRQRKILEGIRKDEPAAWRELYKNGAFGIIKKYVLKNSGNETDGEDIFQEALIEFKQWITQNEFEIKNSNSLKIFIAQFGRNLWHKELRKRKRHPVIYPEEMDNNMAEEIIDLSWDKETPIEAKVIQFVKQEMGDSCRKILYSFFFDGMSHTEIADQYGYKTEKSARNMKSKCMAQLRKSIWNNLQNSNN